jgi:hypothetical protein
VEGGQTELALEGGMDGQLGRFIHKWHQG